MKTVQVAIHDSVYADSIRELLLQDGGHIVSLVELPDVTLGGVILVESTDLGGLPLLIQEQERLVVIVSKELDDLEKIWDAGVRHVLFYGDPPQRARILVLAVELTLSARRPSA